MQPGGVSCGDVAGWQVNRVFQWATELAGSTVFGAPVLFLTLLLQYWDKRRQEGRTFLLI